MDSTSAPSLVVPEKTQIVLPDFSRDIGGYIGRYLKLRNHISEIEARHKEELAKPKELLKMLENGFLKHLQDTNTDNAKAKGVGTAYKKTKASATIADAAEFRRFIIGGERFELVDWKANAPAVKDFIENEGGGVPPPGVNFSTVTTVNVRKD